MRSNRPPAPRRRRPTTPAAAHPPAAPQQPRQRLGAEMLERLVVAEEEALVGGHRLDHLADQRLGAGCRSRSASASRSRKSFALAGSARAASRAGRACPGRSRGRSGSSAAWRTYRRRSCPGSAWLMRAPSAAARAAFGAMRGSGSTAWHRPAWATAPGMPQTTLVASSCATALPPASITRRVPASPSCPMPVSIATSTRPSHAAAALRSIGSTDGRQKFSGGSVRRDAPASPPRAAFDQQMAVAGREIDAAGPQRLAVLRLGTRQPAELGDVLGQHRREVAGMCCVSTTGTLQRLAQPLHQSEQRLRPAGGTADRAAAAAAAIGAGTQAQRDGVARGGWATRRRMRPRPFTFSTSSRRKRRRQPVAGRGLRHIVRGAEPQRAQRDVGAARGQRRGHDHLQAGIGAQQQRQRRHAVHHRHLDVEHARTSTRRWRAPASSSAILSVGRRARRRGSPESASSMRARRRRGSPRNRRRP